jgi:hypothetical protein
LNGGILQVEGVEIEEIHFVKVVNELKGWRLDVRGWRFLQQKVILRFWKG